MHVSFQVNRIAVIACTIILKYTLAVHVYLRGTIWYASNDAFLYQMKVEMNFYILMKCILRQS